MVENTEDKYSDKNIGSTYDNEDWQSKCVSNMYALPATGCGDQSSPGPSRPAPALIQQEQCKGANQVVQRPSIQNHEVGAKALEADGSGLKNQTDGTRLGVMPDRSNRNPAQAQAESAAAKAIEVSVGRKEKGGRLTNDDVANLIIQLGNEKFKERDSAQKKLDEAALDNTQLQMISRAFCRNKDPEIRSRAEQVLRAHGKNPRTEKTLDTSRRLIDSNERLSPKQKLLLNEFSKLWIRGDFSQVRDLLASKEVQQRIRREFKIPKDDDSKWGLAPFMDRLGYHVGTYLQLDLNKGVMNFYVPGEDSARYRVDFPLQKGARPEFSQFGFGLSAKDHEKATGIPLTKETAIRIGSYAAEWIRRRERKER